MVHYNARHGVPTITWLGRMDCSHCHRRQDPRYIRMFYIYGEARKEGSTRRGLERAKF
jgi:hypothetical protein